LAADSKHIDYLITRYLAGESTVEERQQLEQWMNESEANSKYFNDNRFVHDKAVASHKLTRVNVDSAWDKLHRQMKSPFKGQTIQFARKEYLPWTQWLRVAASILILVGLSFWLYRVFLKPSEIKQIAITSSDKTVNERLADNSKVVLNKKSKIVCSSQFGTKNRELSLSGEAYFEVRHSADTPFIVKADEVLIKDIGTAFNVKAYEKANTIEVFVESGEVLFYTSSNPGIKVRKGEKGIYEKATKNFYKTREIEVNVLSYKTKYFVFQNTSLVEVISQLNAIYPLSIRINNSALMNCKITVTFNNEDIGTIASVIAETLGLQVVKLPDGYILEGKSCLNTK
jgi:transmembrane sensor